MGISLLMAWAYFCNVLKLGKYWPLSKRAMVDWVVPILVATSN